MAADSTTWERVPIVDLCAEHVDCVNRTAPVLDEPTPFKMIRTTNVRNGFIDTDNVKYVSEETYKRWTRRLVPKRGDVILTREAPLGDAGKVRSDDHIFLGQRLYHFRPDPNKLDADFLLYALMAPDLQGQIRALGSGSTVEHMRLGDIPSLEIEAPALSVQRRIGGILSAYDELIENNQLRIRILEEMARSLYREWFIHFRFPGHDKVKMVSSPLGPIPQGWEVKKLADLTAFLSRGISPNYDDEGDSIVVNQKCIRGQRLSLEPARRQTKPIPADKCIRFGDVLINSTGVGTLGRVAQVYEVMEQCTVDSHVTIIRRNSDTDIDFFGCALLLKQETFERLGIGATGQTELSRAAIGEVKIPTPPDSLQKRFGALAHSMRTAANTLSKQTETLRRTRDLLLPRLLSGVML
jgi:type I restriction enzyme, S subunit